MTTSPTPTRTVPSWDDENVADGSIFAHSTLSHENYKVGAAVCVPPEKVVPIIFVPGIMGSNIKIKKDVPEFKDGSGKTKEGYKKDDPAWRPPNTGKEDAAAIYHWGKLGPTDRQAILDPKNTEIDPDGPVAAPAPLTNKSAKARGWGTVHSDSYGAILSFLQSSLNDSMFAHTAGSVKVADASIWQRLLQADGKKHADKMFKLEESEIKKLADYHLPVYANGYNWLQTNATAAKLLAEKIEKVIAYWNNDYFSCKKVILVTHSMGGLVSRYCAQLNPGNILGITHSVMPAIGAPLAYRRIALGMEHTSPNGWVPTAGPMAVIAGYNTAETTAVMANAPGPLELLPNQLYKKGWLTAELNTDGKISKTVLPASDPYSEIYKEPRAWYRLIDPALIDPLNRNKAVGKAWKAYLENIGTAEKFHATLGAYYHPKTYVNFGNDKNQLSYDTIHRQKIVYNYSTEEQSDMLANGVTPPDDTDGVPPPAAPGDGTVPQESGNAPPSQPFKAGLPGFDHQGSYNNVAVRDATLYAICKLLQDAP